MESNENQKILQDSIMKALDDTELEEINGGISKRTIAEIAGAVAIAALIVRTGIVENKTKENAKKIKKLSDNVFNTGKENIALRDSHVNLYSQRSQLKDDIANVIIEGRELDNTEMNFNRNDE